MERTTLWPDVRTGEQNPDLKTELLASGNNCIAESGKHDYYDVGLLDLLHIGTS